MTTYIVTRILWTGMGLSAITLGVVTETDFWVKAVVALGGLVSLLLSILFGGFVKHLASHGDHTQALACQLDERCERLFQLLAKTQTLEDCRRQHEADRTTVAARMECINAKLNAMDLIHAKIAQVEASMPDSDQLHEHITALESQVTEVCVTLRKLVE